MSGGVNEMASLSEGTLSKRAVGRGRKAKVLLAIVAALVLVIAVPLAAQAWNSLSQKPTYTWYTDGTHAGTADDPYRISTVGEYRGFVNIVNGTYAESSGVAAADDFTGKYVVLANSLSLDTNGTANVIDPIGTPGTEREFNGTFDGQGFTINNYTVTAAEGAAATNLGLFGQCGEGSTIKNVVVGSGAKLSITKSADDAIQVRNVGLLVGFSEGSVENCTNNGTVTIETNYDQTKELLYTTLNVGGLAGNVLGDVTNCTNNGAMSVVANGASYTPTEAEEEAGLEQEAIMVMNTGGVVGCAGATDNLVDPDAGTAHGTVSGCTNTAKISLNTPCEAGKDRFDQTVYSESVNTGGVAGYSRGSVLKCVNSGYVRAEKGTYAAGVVGNVRGRSKSVNASSSFQTYDEGMVNPTIDDTLGCTGYDVAASEAGTIYVQECVNKGDVMGNSSPGGVVACAGTYTVIEACANGTATATADKNPIVMGTRWNKPYPAGIVASARGVVRYCANYGTAMSGVWDDEAARTYKKQDGYYATGIAGNTRYYYDKHYTRVSPVPEVYGCYNVGQCLAGDNMRQRGIVGDNAGNVFNNLLVEGVVYNDAIGYGLYAGDTEATGGTFANNYVIPADLLKSNGWFKFVSTDKYLVEADENGTMNAITVLNGKGDVSGWDYYWVQDKNSGWPVLNIDTDWTLTPITDANVSLAANASYTSVSGAVPQATVTLDGKTLVQGQDFKVVPQEGAIEITTTTDEPTPYVATIIGIGNYTGTALQTMSYGIATGDISTCSVNIDNQMFDWNAHVLTAKDITVKSLAGNVVDASEFTFTFDPADTDLTKNAETGELEAVNAETYDVIITATDSGHYTGSTTGKFKVKSATIMYSTDAEKRADLAYPVTISYAGQTYDWESTIALSDKAPEDQIPSVTFEYTGHPIDPSVVEVTYKGKALEESTDYKVSYGDYELLEKGVTIPAGTENVGVKGGTASGYIKVACIPGGNFTNYDLMKFTIVDTEATVSLDGAELRGTGDVTYEGEQEYEPVTVWYANQQLTEGTDYTITYKNNTAPGTASFEVNAIDGSPFSGSLSGTFDIVEVSPYTFYYTLDDSTMTATVTGVVYHGINDEYDMEIPAAVEFEGGDYQTVVYDTTAKSHSLVTGTAVAGTYSVTAIGQYAFGGGGTRGAADSWTWTGADYTTSKIGIRSVTIPATVQTIGDYAFAGGVTFGDWRILSEVTFADVEDSQLTTIGQYAFAACGNLTEFTFPAQVKTIGTRAFCVGTKTQVSNIKKLTFLTTSATLPSSVAKTYTFQGIGGSSSSSTVEVYARAGATAVRKLVTNNANTSSYGTNGGMRWTAKEYVPDVFEVSKNFYTSASQMYVVTYKGEVADGSRVLLDGVPMFAKGKTFVKLVDASTAKALTNDDFTVEEGQAPVAAIHDVNCNNKVNIVDAQVAYEIACGSFVDFTVVTETGWMAADANNDKVVDAADALLIHTYIHNRTL